MAPTRLGPGMATVDVDSGQGAAGKLAALLGGEGAGGLAYVAFMGFVLPAAVLLAVGALGGGPDGAGLAGGIGLFVAAVVVFEVGWYVGTGGE